MIGKKKRHGVLFWVKLYRQTQKSGKGDDNRARNLCAYTNRPPCLSTWGPEYSCLSLRHRYTKLLLYLRAVALLLGGVVVDLTQYLDSHLESALSVPNAHQGLALFANATDKVRQLQF